MKAGPNPPGGTGGDRGQKYSVWQKVMGRPQLEDAIRKRFEPYSYESNARNLRWVSIALIAWAVASVLLAWSDRVTLRELEGFQAQGISSIPPSSTTSFEDIINFAARENIDCPTTEALLTSAAQCERVVEIVRKFSTTQDRTNGLFALLGLIWIAIGFLWGAMVHRASRNLPTLKSEGQRFSPDSAVIWTVLAGAAFMVTAVFGPAVFVGGAIAVAILVWKVLPAMIELLKASDPAVASSTGDEWKETGSAPAHVYIWIVAAAMVFLVNPITIARFMSRESLSELIAVLERIFLSDLFMVLPAVIAVLMLWEIHRRQELKHARVGPVVVAPRQPLDPLMAELERAEHKDQKPRTGIRMSGKSDRKK